MSNKKDQTCSKTLVLRLPPELLDRLQSGADRLGCSVSQAARIVLKRKSHSASESLSGGETNRRLVLAVRGTRDDIRKLTSDYHTFVTLFREAVEREGIVNTDGLSYATNMLTALTVKIRDLLNEQLQFLKDNPVEWKLDEEPSSTEEESVPAGQDDGQGSVMSVRRKTKEELEIEYCYMEDITIMGAVNSPVSFFTSSQGVEGMRFVVSVLARDGRRTDYLVLSGRGGIADYLNLGRQVVVVGELSIDLDKRELVIRADRIKLTSIQ